MSKVCVIGGGNIGTLLYAELTRLNPTSLVTLVTRDPSRWSKTISVLDAEGRQEYAVDAVVSDQPMIDADYYFFTLPKQVTADAVRRCLPIARVGSVFVFVPGTGGMEYLYPAAAKYGITFAGLQRVPYISRVSEYGKSVVKLSVKDCLYGCGLGIKDLSFLETLIQIKCQSLPNYLNVSLTPSNPILHTSRVYSLFVGHRADKVYPINPRFYAEWDDHSSTVLLRADAELQQICTALKSLDLSQVVSLKVHYESETVEALTQKMRSIKSLSGVLSPLRQVDNGYVVDYSSRYFKEDFEYGLVLIKAIAQICQIETPTVDQILDWYGETVGCPVLKDSTLINKEEWLIPQNYGITTVDQLESFYREIE